MVNLASALPIGDVPGFKCISPDLFLANIHEDLDLLFAPSFPLEGLAEELNNVRDASQS